ncbi:MAG: ribokinase [Bacilli bacterium]|jgi:sugar/nucleoside kinase (ribokinase family)|nr:ribokinase [Bacilli bacterium]
MTVYVVGELNVDMIVTGADVVPEWNREKLVDSFDLVLGSSSAITACALAGLGMDVRFVSVVGTDDFGDFCIEQLKQRGVNTKGVKQDSSMKTGVTLSLSTPTDRGLLTYMGSIPAITPADLPEELYANATHVHFGSYFLQDGMRAHWHSLFHRLRQNGCTTSFDTGWDVRNLWYRDQIDLLLEETDLFIPSEEELLHIYDASALEEVWAKLPIQRNWVAVKRGARGAVMSSPNRSFHSVNAYPITPIDTTGAGDSFNAGLIYGYLNGKREEELLLFANVCGALATLAIGGIGHKTTLQDVEVFQNSHKTRS